MSLPFLINVLIAFLGLRQAWMDHGETFAEFKSARGRAKWKPLKGLAFLWGVPVLSSCLLPFIWNDSVEIATLSRSAISTSNKVVSLGNDLVISSNRLTRTESALKSVERQYTEATNKLAVIDRRTEVKPLNERLMEWLNSVDTNIVQKVKGVGSSSFQGLVPETSLAELAKLRKEPGADRYFRMLPPGTGVRAGENLSEQSDRGTFIRVAFEVDRRIIEDK